MSTNIDRFRADYERLVQQGELLHDALLALAYGDEYRKEIGKRIKSKEKLKAFLDALPDFKSDYQAWYSEGISLIKQVLPDRLNDFIRLYEKPKGRKDVGFENYRIEDALQGLRVTRIGDVLADSKSAVPHFKQQLAIVRSIGNRFESSLYDIKQLVQADLFDSELEAARELLKNKFVRAAGAMAGVVLEKHLGQVAASHNVKISKKHPGISDLNEALKAAQIIETPQWRFIQHLGDIRNLCDHSKAADPTQDDVSDLVAGVAKVTKTIF